jgi:hypothetical protein
MDIVERLRAMAAAEAGEDDCLVERLDALHYAADEIERVNAVSLRYFAEVARCQDEIERLRERVAYYEALAHRAIDTLEDVGRRAVWPVNPSR